MLKKHQQDKQRWGGTNQAIDRWLLGRQELLVQYCALSAEQQHSHERANTLRRLCQVMVDYVSAGHFEIYHRLVHQGREQDDLQGLNEAAEHFKIVDATTEPILDFNDKYLATDDLSSLNDDLSVLGETLETRFSGEDRMIAVLHDAHKNSVVAG